MAHKVEDRGGLKVTLISQMQDRADKVGKTIPGRSFDPPLETVQVRDIAEYYGIDIRDIWPLVFESQMGQRVPYNNGTEVISDHTERKQVEQVDVLGRPHMEPQVVTVKHMAETDDGMYAKLKDVLRWAKQHGWVPGGGLPEDMAARHQQTDMADIKEMLKGLTEAVTVLAKLQAQQMSSRK